MGKQIKAWHFLPEDRRCRLLEDGSRPEIAPGTVLVEKRPLELCRVGLHASVRAIDALQYAKGPVVCRVECEGEIIYGNDKLCCSKRTVLWMADATRVLSLFSCDVAEEALWLVDETDLRSWEAVAAAREWVDGKISEAALLVAHEAAFSAIGVVGKDSCWAAVRAWSASHPDAVFASLSAARACSDTIPRTPWRKHSSARCGRLESALAALEGR